jgi:Cd2+/Zn2+-exporting ATPase
MQDLGVTITAENDHSDVEIETIVHVCAGNEYLGHIVIADEIKPNAAEAIRDLRGSGVTKTVMLTGDAEAIASRVAKKLGIDEYHAGLLPADKVTRLEQLLDETGSFAENAGSSKNVSSGKTASTGKNAATGKNVGSSKKGTLAFVGDGINDAPVLSRADIGIAMGALGSDAAIEAADVVLMDDDPMKIARAIRLARKCIRIVNENIWFAIGVKLACLLLGALGIANMWLAIFADVGVMVLCVLNAIRALV